jgi:hypothetical protein
MTDLASKLAALNLSQDRLSMLSLSPQNLEAFTKLIQEREKEKRDNIKKNRKTKKQKKHAKKSKQSQLARDGKSASKKTTRSCSRCGGRGHYAKTCVNTKRTSLPHDERQQRELPFFIFICILCILFMYTHSSRPASAAEIRAATGACSSC